MENNNNSSYYEIEIKDEMAIVRIKEKVFDLITDIHQSGNLLEFIKNIDHDQKIKVLLFYNDPESFSVANYDKFVTGLWAQTMNAKPMTHHKISEKNIRFREINILNGLIKQMASLQTIVVSGIQGEVVTPFVGCFPCF